MFIALRIAWGVVASSRWQAEIDCIHAEGVPIFAHDFPATKGLPPERNAANYYHRAFAAIDWRDRDELSFDDAISYFRAAEEYPNEFDAIVLANQDVVDLIRQARGAPDTDWEIHVASRLMDTTLDYLGEIRRIARVLFLTVLSRHRHHDDAEALRIVEDILLLAERTPQVDSYCPFISLLVAITLQQRCTFVLERMIPTMSIGDHAEEDGTVPRGKIIEMIKRLLDEENLWGAYSAAMNVERAICIDTIEFLLASANRRGLTHLDSSGVLVFVKPAWRLDTIRVCRHLEGARKAGMSRNWSKVADHGTFCGPDTQENSIQTMAFYPSYMFGTSMRRPTMLLYRNIAHRRMTAIALAIRLFEIDHGHRPTALAELAPEYLDTLPIDPFAKESEPIRYLPDAEPPLLYSVNQNQIDEQGKFMTPGDQLVNNEDFDFVFFLNGDRPTPDLSEDQRLPRYRKL